MNQTIQIRSMLESDISEISKFLQEEKINFFTNLSSNTERLKNNLQKYQKTKRGERRVILLGDTQIIGSIVIKKIKEGQKAELGYRIGKDFEGKGYMTQALRIFLQYVFQEKQLERLQAIVREDNIGSMKLLEKIGFKLEGTMRNFKKRKDKFYNFHLYSILKSDFIK